MFHKHTAAKDDDDDDSDSSSFTDPETDSDSSSFTDPETDSSDDEPRKKPLARSNALQNVSKPNGNANASTTSLKGSTKPTALAAPKLGGKGAKAAPKSAAAAKSAAATDNNNNHNDRQVGLKVRTPPQQAAPKTAAAGKSDGLKVRTPPQQQAAPKTAAAGKSDGLKVRTPPQQQATPKTAAAGKSDGLKVRTPPQQQVKPEGSHQKPRNAPEATATAKASPKKGPSRKPSGSGSHDAAPPASSSATTPTPAQASGKEIAASHPQPHKPASSSPHHLPAQTAEVRGRGAAKDKAGGEAKAAPATTPATAQTPAPAPTAATATAATATAGKDQPGKVGGKALAKESAPLHHPIHLHLPSAKKPVGGKEKETENQHEKEKEKEKEKDKDRANASASVKESKDAKATWKEASDEIKEVKGGKEAKDAKDVKDVKQFKDVKDTKEKGSESKVAATTSASKGATATLKSPAPMSKLNEKKGTADPPKSTAAAAATKTRASDSSLASSSDLSDDDDDDDDSEDEDDVSDSLESRPTTAQAAKVPNALAKAPANLAKMPKAQQSYMQAQALGPQETSEHGGGGGFVASHGLKHRPDQAEKAKPASALAASMSENHHRGRGGGGPEGPGVEAEEMRAYQGASPRKVGPHGGVAAGRMPSRFPGGAVGMRLAPSWRVPPGGFAIIGQLSQLAGRGPKPATSAGSMYHHQGDTDKGPRQESSDQRHGGRMYSPGSPRGRETSEAQAQEIRELRAQLAELGSQLRHEVRGQQGGAGANPPLDLQAGSQQPTETGRALQSAGQDPYYASERFAAELRRNGGEGSPWAAEALARKQEVAGANEYVSWRLHARGGHGEASSAGRPPPMVRVH